MLSLTAQDTVKFFLANAIRTYCTNTPFTKGKYRLQLLAMERLKFQKNIPYTYFGTNLNIDLNSTVGSRLFYFSEYEAETINLALNLIKEGDVFLDIGANIGIYSMAASKKGAKVFSFEPHPEAFLDLQNNIALNPDLEANVNLLNMALSDKDGNVDFICAPDSAYSSLGNAISSGRSNQFSTEHKISVPSTTIDSFISKYKIESIALCKIDVEGGELNVLRGAKGALSNKKIKLILLEINSVSNTSSNYTPDKLIEFLDSYGYRADNQKTGKIKDKGFSSGNFLFS
jgi:FkbM family methyltransferase